MKNLLFTFNTHFTEFFFNFALTSLHMLPWYLLFCMDDCLVMPDSHPCRITSTKSRKNTVVSPDDGHIVTPKHVEIYKRTKKNCWLYLQKHTAMHGQQNIKEKILH